MFLRNIYRNGLKYRKYYTVSSNHEEKFAKQEKQTFNELTRNIQAQIKAKGPLTVAEYMRIVLTNPLSGYYMHSDVLGKSGDFVTSPELGQMFGEMVAIWFLNEWKKIGCPKPFQIVELGPGRGSLCADILKVFNHFKVSSGCSVHLVELSPFLRDVQSRQLCLTSEPNESNPKDLSYYRGKTINGLEVKWYNRIQDVPKNFSLFVAHEFFDALPIQKYQRTENGFKEILINNDPNLENGFRYVISQKELIPSTKILLNNENMKGIDHAEISTESILLVDHLADRVVEDGGIALIADYGKNGQPGDTFRAFKKHKLHDPLVEPGSADLTADVDFNLLRSVAMEKQRCLVFGPVEQGKFLKSMGIDHRLESLLKNAKNEEEEKALKFAHDMMTDPKKMGERFKLISLFPYILKEHLTKFPVIGFS